MREGVWNAEEGRAAPAEERNAAHAACVPPTGTEMRLFFLGLVVRWPPSSVLPSSQACRLPHLPARSLRGAAVSGNGLYGGTQGQGKEQRSEEEGRKGADAA